MSDRQRAEMAEAKLRYIRDVVSNSTVGWAETVAEVQRVVDAPEFGGYWQGEVHVKAVTDGLREYALRKVAEDLEALPSDHDVYRPLDHKEP